MIIKCFFIYDSANNINGRCVEDDALQMKVNGFESSESNCVLIFASWWRIISWIINHAHHKNRIWQVYS